MIYTRYLEKVLGNKTKIAMLRAFYKVPDKVWTSRGLADFIGTYNTTVLDNLGDLEEMGILIIGSHGKVKTIKVNKDSFIFKEMVKPLFQAEKNSLDKLIKDLKAMLGPKDAKLFLVFGSIVDQKERPNSDIDLIVVTENKGKIDKIIENNQHVISNKYGNGLSFFFFLPQ